MRTARRALKPLVVLAFALATLVSTQARAAVPMCGNDGSSVAAPPIVMPWRMIALDAPAPCPHADPFLVLSLPEHQPRSPSVPTAPAPLKALPLRGGDLARPPYLLLRIEAPGAPTSLELVASLYRPPRS